MHGSKRAGCGQPSLTPVFDELRRQTGRLVAAVRAISAKLALRAAGLPLA